MHNQNGRLPPLEWIRAFEAAARRGSFTAAAAETGLTQSAISQRIAHLETYLGAKLFYRHPRSITLTLEGEAWMPHVRAALETLQESTKSLFGVARGRLTISASQSIIQLWLGPRLDRLRAITGTQISLQTMVLGGHDAPQDDAVAVRYGSGGWPHAYKLRLYAEEVTPVAAPKLAGTAGDWTEWPRIAVSGPRPGWAEFSAKYGIPSTPVPGLLFDTYGPAQGAARAGLGVILASLPLCRAEIEAGTLVRLSADVMAHHESYWLLAGRDAVSRVQWDALEGVLADIPHAARVS